MIASLEKSLVVSFEMISKRSVSSFTQPMGHRLGQEGFSQFSRIFDITDGCGYLLRITSLYGSSYYEEPHSTHCFSWAQIWLLLSSGWRGSSMLHSAHPSHQSVLHKVQNHNENVNVYSLKPERPKFPKPGAICLIIYLGYLCFRTSPESCLLSCLWKRSLGWLERLWTTRNY